MTMKPRMPRTVTIAIMCVLFGALAGLALRGYVSSTNASLDSIAVCMRSSNEPTGIAQCLKRVVPNLLQRHTTQELMSYIVATSTPAAVTDQCHAIGHIIGEYTYEKNHSLEHTLSACTNSCRYSCKHGAIGASVIDELGISYDDEDVAHSDLASFEKLSTTYCAHNETTCHGIGHLAYMLAKNEDAAVRICDAATSGSILREVCYQGVFMERAGTFDNMLYPGEEIVPTYELGNYTYPCTSVAPLYRHACFLFTNGYQLPLFAADHIDTPSDRLKKAIAVCNDLQDRDRANCFEGIGGSSITFDFKKIGPEVLQPLCDMMPTESDRSACTLGVIPQFFYGHEHELFPYCDAIAESNRVSLCYNAVFEWIEARERFSDDSKRMCSDNANCAARYETYTRVRDSLPDYRLGLFGK